MLVFGSHCPEICDHFRQPAEYSGATWLHVYMIPVIFNHYTLSPVSLHTLHLIAPPSTGNCYNEQQNNRLNPCWFMLCFERHGRYNNLMEWFTWNPFDWKILGLLLRSNIRYLHCSPTALSSIFPCYYVYILYEDLILRLNVLWSIIIIEIWKRFFVFFIFFVVVLFYLHFFEQNLWVYFFY